MQEQLISKQRLEIITSIKVLEETIAWYKPQIEPTDCGWMYTTISGIQHRIQNLKKNLKKVI